MYFYFKTVTKMKTFIYTSLDSQQSHLHQSSSQSLSLLFVYKYFFGAKNFYHIIWQIKTIGTFIYNF
jgi:hypothetical protein